MKIDIVKSLFAILIFVNLSCISPASKDNLYYDALKEAKSGNVDFAFMKLNDYLRVNPDSPHTKEIRFAVVEYYLQIKDYRDAIYKLSEYIKAYPEDEGKIFAQALLYKALLEYKDQSPLIEKIKENFFSKSIFLIFSEAKTKSYKSIFNNIYKIVDYIDKIEVFKNDDLFLKITP